jgi:hypothetical protein
LKSLSAILLLLILSFSLSLRMMVIFEWKLNQDYITKNLCENRANPKSCCKGKCQLKKKLSKIENDSDTKNENNTKLNKIVCVDVFDIMDSEFNFDLIRSLEIALHYSCFQNNYSFSIPVKLLRPPSNSV